MRVEYEYAWPRWFWKLIDLPSEVKFLDRDVAADRLVSYKMKLYEYLLLKKRCTQHEQLLLSSLRNEIRSALLRSTDG